MTATAEIPNPTPSHARLMQLDVLRGVAILLVLFRHAIVPYQYAGPFQRIMRFLECLGWTGVDLFFVLSGFLIGGLLFKEIQKTGRLDVKRFYIRRGLKIWPAYFLFLFVVYFIHGYRFGLPRAWHYLWPNLLQLQNYLARPPGLTWSLAVEEHFYLVLPLLLLIVLPWWRQNKLLHAVPIATAILILVCTALRFTNWNKPFDEITQFTPTHLRMDGLFFGVFLAYLFHMQPQRLARIARHRTLLLLIGLALVIPMGFDDVVDHRWVWTIGFTMLYLGYGCILIACVYSPPGDFFGNLLASRPAALLAWIGVFSYSIYLWQFDISYNPVTWYVMPHLPHHPVTVYWMLSMAIYLTLAILGGALLSRIVEFPVLKLRDRLFPARADAVPARPVNAECQLPSAQSAECPVPNVGNAGTGSV